MSEIPRIEIREVNIPKIPIWELYVPILDVIYKPKVDIPGCVRVHRNNLPSLIDNDKDEYGTYSECGNFIIPSFEPLEYNPSEFIYTEADTPKEQEETLTPTDQSGQYVPPKNKKVEFVECPGRKDQRVGDFRNEKRLERVVGHERSEDGTICTTLYEDVPFKDQYIPEVSTIVSTAVIGLVAASTPLLLNAVKPLVKQIVKKLTKKKKDVK